jgi:hypothetical protein
MSVEPARAIVLREIVPLDDPRKGRMAAINQVARLQVCKIAWPVFGESPQKSASSGHVKLSSTGNRCSNAPFDMRLRIPTAFSLIFPYSSDPAIGSLSQGNGQSGCCHFHVMSDRDLSLSLIATDMASDKERFYHSMGGAILVPAGGALGSLEAVMNLGSATCRAGRA